MKAILNSEYDKTSEVHWILHPQSGFKCTCSVCRNSKPLKAKNGKIGKVYYAKVDR